ncbi:TPA: hypothetical protein ACH3X2_008952 [Trebouxia sp. C0005]
MAGKSPRVLVTPTPDLGKILNAMQDLDIEGASDLPSSVQIAQLALKHRQNKNQRQRAVIFVGSPIKEDKDKLVKIAKKMKKNNVAVDIVSFGSEEQNTEKLEAFHEAVNSGDNSHLVTVPPGMILSDSLFGSPIFQGEGAAGYGGGSDGEAAGGGGGTGFEFGIDPSLDPELALALRVSMEEERARNAAAGVASGEASEPVPAASGQTEGQPQSADTPVPMDEDALLQQALAMSMQVDQPEEAAQPAAETTSTIASAKQDEEMEDMDEELHRALQMSMQDHGDTSAAPGGDMQQILEDSTALNSILGTLPGVNPEDPALQASLQASLRDMQDKDSKDKDKKDSK